MRLATRLPDESRTILSTREEVDYEHEILTQNTQNWWAHPGSVDASRIDGNV